MIDRDTILKNLQAGSNDIAGEFDALHIQKITELAEELATSYETLKLLIDKADDDPTRLNDTDFQSALFYWSALNTIFSAIDLLRRGYSKEPQMLMRNALETFSAAYDLHVHPEKLTQLLEGKRFGSTASITEAKKVHKIIGQWYGMLSEEFTHVGRLHLVPHHVINGQLAMGGHFDANDQTIAKINLLIITGTLDVLDSLLELTFITYVPHPRFWIKADGDTYTHQPNKERVQSILDEMKPLLEELGN